MTIEHDVNVPKFVYSRAEDIQGYEKFTLDEVVYPDQVIWMKNLRGKIWKVLKTFPTYNWLIRFTEFMCEYYSEYCNKRNF